MDQDGQDREAGYRDRVRELSLRRRPDGSGSIRGELTGAAAELLDTYLGATAAPTPGPDGHRDDRSAGQRRHDTLLGGLKALLASGATPDTGGCRTTVTLTMDVEDFATHTGTARTGYGYPVPVEVAKTWLEPEARAILVLLSATKGIAGYSSVQRLFTEQQRLAMAARDRGCSYWGCDAPAAWTEAHHVQEWQHTHRTAVDQGALACKANHRTFESMGWINVMFNGRPHWIPPSWIDEQQQPRRNDLHD